MAFLLLAGVVLLWLAGVLWSAMTITISASLTEEGEGQGVNTSKTFTVTGDALISATVALGASATNVEILVGFDTAKLKGLMFLADQDVTLYTNAASSGSPNDTIALAAGVPWIWYEDSGIDIDDLIVGNSGVVTKLYATNGSATAATLRIRGTKDATP